MKKRVVMLFAIAVVFTALVRPVLAADSNILLFRDPDMIISMPSELIVLTPGSDPGDNSYASLGLDEESLQVYIESLKSGNIYMQAISPDWSYWVTLTVVDSDQKDYKICSDSVLMLYAADLTANTTGEIKEIEHTIYEASQMTYITTYAESEYRGISYYAMDFTTVLDGKKICISLTPSFGEVSSEMEWVLQQFVDGLTFTKEVRSSLVTFIEAGINFRRAAEWVEQVESGTQEQNSEVSFIHASGNEILFSYEFLGYEASSDDYSRNDIKELLEADGSEIQSVGTETVDSIEFFKINRMADKTNIISHVLIKNGVLYQFSFVGDESDVTYEAYLWMLSSVFFETGETTDDYENGAIPPLYRIYALPETYPEFSFFLAILLSISVTIVIYFTPVIIVRYLIMKKPVNHAGTVTVIWGVLAFIAAALIWNFSLNYIPAATVVLWSFVNDIVLKMKKLPTHKKIR